MGCFGMRLPGQSHRLDKDVRRGPGIRFQHTFRPIADGLGGVSSRMTTAPSGTLFGWQWFYGCQALAHRRWSQW